MRYSFLIILAACTVSSLSAAEATWAQVQTVLSARCTNCHGEKKQKAGLRLDSPEWLEKGSNLGAVVVAGKPEISKLYTMASLPEDHDDRMPPTGARLTAEQLEILKSWIAAGAKTAALGNPVQPPAQKAGAAPESTDMGMAEASMADSKLDDAKSEVVTPAKPPPAPVHSAPIHSATETPIIPAPAAPEFAITALTTQQFVIETLPGGWLDVNAGHTKKGLTDAHLPLLAKVGPAVAFLDLANSGITDRQLKVLTDFTNLQRLHLERTPITDAGLGAVASCQHLTYLNVYGTEITDKGLAALKSLSQLEELYVWQSKVTPAGIAALRKALPDLTINNGPDDLPKSKLDGKKKKKK